MVAWPSGQNPYFIAGGSCGAARFKSWRGNFQFFFFLSSFFYPLAFYCLFLLTPLASRDFCENVFLVNVLLLFCFDIAKFPLEVLITSKALTLL